MLGASLAPAERVPRRVVARSCCRRTYLRGAFIASGSLTDPRAGAHLELRSSSPESAEELAELAAEEGFPLTVHVGGRHAIAYAKRGETIRDLLVALGAHGSELRLEEAAVLAETRAQANRLANADAGNLRRHARAAEEQLAAIEALGGVDELPGGLRVVAELRVTLSRGDAVRAGRAEQPDADARDRRGAPAADRRARRQRGVTRNRRSSVNPNGCAEAFLLRRIGARGWAWPHRIQTPSGAVSRPPP